MYSLRLKEHFDPDVESGHLARAKILEITDDDEIGLSPSLLAGLDFGGRIPFAEPNSVYRVKETVEGTHPEQLSVKKGDLVLKKFSLGGQFYRQCYEEEDYVFRNKFPHISDKTFNNMKGNVFIYARKLGAEQKTGTRNVPFPDVGSDPMLLLDSETGMVPLRCLEKRGEPVEYFRTKKTHVELHERCAARPRFALPGDGGGRVEVL